MRVITADGYDIASTTPLSEPVSLAVDAHAKATVKSLPVLPYQTYQPGPYLWPISWSPTVGLSSGTDTSQFLGLELSAQDPLSHHMIAGTLSTQDEEKALGVTLSYVYRRYVPTYTLSLAHQTNTQAKAAYYGSTRHPYRSRSTVGSAAISLPLNMLGFSSQSTIRYALSVSEPTDSIEPVHHPLQRAPIIPEGRQSASLSASLGIGSTERRYHAVSTESGWQGNVSMRLRRPELGGEIETAELFWNASTYANPWLRHVLALRLQGAFGRGDPKQAIAYGLGQPAERNVFFDALDEINMGSGFLRGYPGNSAVGDRYVLATGEYRLPVSDIFRGIETVPVFLRRLQLAMFTDWAQARYSALSWSLESTYGSAGAELLSKAPWGGGFPSAFDWGTPAAFSMRAKLKSTSSWVDGSRTT